MSEVRRSPKKPSIIVVCGCMLVLTGLLIGLSPQHYFSWLDKPLLLAFRTHEHLDVMLGPPWMAGAMRDITALGSSAVLTLVSISVIVFLLVSKMRRRAAIFAISVLSGLLMMSSLKLFFARVRPTDPPALEVETGFSFPSGHAMMSTLIYFSILLVCDEVLSDSQRAWLAVCCAFLAVAIGITRVALGVHYPSDVLAGWLVGSGLTLCWRDLLRTSLQRQDNTNRPWI